jgi:Tol biopolymer transport system component
MTLAPGARLGPYEIVGAIASGGMGNVYRARDAKLGRDVALKILPASFTHDPDRLARFRREAQLLAALNHPHIAQIHGFEEASGTPFLVLELVDGASLADRVRHGPLPIDEALAIGKQIAAALEATHEKGIIHRDLKPANIVLTPDGQVKVLDFGLAKAAEGAGAGSVDLANSPTITSPAMMTGVGTILGTAAYMSPEQAKGAPADKRCDIWAFGCVLYEMLAGRRAFDGEDLSETLAAVLRGEPNWAALPKETPASIRRLVRRALEKDRRSRLADIADARLEIDDAAREPSAVNSARVQASIPRGHQAIWAATVVALFLTSAALGVRVFFAPAAQAPAVRFDVVPPEGVTLPIVSVPQLSPDGRTLAFVGTLRSQSVIWVRSLDARTAQPLSGTEGAQSLPIFWSPDSQFIGFRDAQGTLKKVSAAGGQSQVITNKAQRDGTWNADGMILMGGSGPLQRVAASGGSPTAETELDASRLETTHDFPNFFPDGQHYLFLTRSRAPSGGPAERAVYVGKLGEKARHRLSGITTEAKYSATGHILFLRDSALMAQPFDVHRLELSGDPFPVTEQAFFGVLAPFSVALNGTLAFRANALSATELGWFDRKGTQLAVVAPLGVYQGLDLSQGSQFAAFSRGTYGNTDVWVLDLQNGRTTRLTSNPDSFNPIWSPDGRTIVFGSNRSGGAGLYQRAVGVVGEDMLLLQMPDTFTLPWSWSRDGRYLAFETYAHGRSTLWALPMVGERKPLRIAELTKGGIVLSAFRAAISPDGRWIAYQSDESGQSEVVIQSFPEPGLKQQVSTAGGVQPCWNQDGNELFYVTPNGMLMSVMTTPGRSGLELSASRPLFQTRLLDVNTGDITLGRKYDVSADGHFLMSVTAERAGEQTTPLTVVLNWFTPFKK